MQIQLQVLDPLDVSRPFLAEGVKPGLILTRRIEPPVDAELFHQTGKAETTADHPDRANNRCWISKNFVGRAGQPIAPAGGHVFSEGQHRHLFLVGELADAGGDQVRLHRAAARRVDQQGDGGDILGLERLFNVGGEAFKVEHRAAAAQRAAVAGRTDDPMQAQDMDRARRSGIAAPEQAAKDGNFAEHRATDL